MTDDTKALETRLTKEEVSSLKDRSVLVIGLSPETNQSVVQPLRDLGIAAQGTTEPEQASNEFNAADFELIVFGRGALGQLSDRLKAEFSRQYPSIRMIDAIGPVAVKQTIAALLHDPETPRFVDEFRVVSGEAGDRVRARVLARCRIAVTLFRLKDERLATGNLVEIDARPGPFEQGLDADRMNDAHSLLLTADDEEFHLHSFLDG